MRSTTGSGPSDAERLVQGEAVWQVPEAASADPSYAAP